MRNAHVCHCLVSISIWAKISGFCHCLMTLSEYFLNNTYSEFHAGSIIFYNQMTELNLLSTKKNMKTLVVLGNIPRLSRLLKTGDIVNSWQLLHRKSLHMNNRLSINLLIYMEHPFKCTRCQIVIVIFFLASKTKILYLINMILLKDIFFDICYA